MSEDKLLMRTMLYLLKVNNRDTRQTCEICAKLIIKTPERRKIDGAAV